MPVDRLAQIEAPSLALAGGTSPDSFSEGARIIAATIPGAEWRILEGQGHGAADEVLIPVLTEFFTRRS